MSTINELNANLITVIDILNRLSNAISSVDATDDQVDQLNILLEDFTSSITGTVTELEDEIDDEESESVDIPEVSSDYYYGIGETCLLLDPFDNYRVFNLYTDYTSKTPLDLSDGQKLYIVFRNGSKEIRVEEFTDYSSNINIDKANGQVLFKITKKQAQDIMNLKNNVFYITRVYETYNATTDAYVTSDEEVLFSGYWVERTEGNESKYKQMIESLQELLEERTAAMQAMVDTINSLVTQNTEYAEQITTLKSEMETLQSEYDDLCSKIEEMGEGLLETLTGEGATGEIIDSQTILVNYADADDETKTYLDKITGTSSNISTTSIDDLEDVIL